MLFLKKKTTWIPIINLSYLFLIPHNLVGSPKKQLAFDNRVYEENIRSVQIYPVQGYPEDVVQPAISSIAQVVPLMLEFDDIYEEVDDYRVKVIHCNADWSPSRFLDLDLLDEYNEFRITEYELSFNTRTEYVHYWFRVPKVKVSGNYLLVVF